jgi:hypothetical protein
VNFRKIGIIALVVVVVHAAIFFVITHVPALPKARYIPPPNFGTRTEIYEDTKTGERTIYREFRVSTKLAPRPTPTSDGITAAK